MRLRLQIVDELRKAQERLGSAGLAKEIAATGKAHIDRRRLAQMIESEKYVLRHEEFEALDEWLRSRGEPGLADKPLFERIETTLIDCFSQSKQISVVVSARPRSGEHRTHFDLWDFRAVAELSKRLGTVARNATIGVHEDVRQENEQSPPDEISRVLRDPQSIACIGAPCRASNLAELMLAQMFGVENEAFCPPSNRSTVQLPFYFAWPDDPQRPTRPSRFAQTPAQVKLKLSAPNDERAFIITGEKPMVSRWKDDCRIDYGVVVAQRRHANNQCWVAFAGQSGPATLATVQASDLPIKLESGSTGIDGPVYYAVIATTVERAPHDKGDSRRIKSVEVVHGPLPWASI